MLEDAEAEFRRVFGRMEDEPLPDVSKFPEFLMEFESPPGTYFDAFPLLIMTTESLATLAAAAPDQAFRRGAVPPQPADRDRLGCTLSGAGLDGSNRPDRLRGARDHMDCPRCVMTTHGFGELPKDPGIMRTLVRENGGDLGVYATVKTPGSVGSATS